MYCKNCGSQIQPNQRFCQNCGAQINPNQNQVYLPKQIQPDTYSNQKQPYNGYQNQAYNNYQNQNQMYNTYPNQGKPAKQLSMWWFKFIIYFQLFVASIVSLFNAVQYFTGSMYGDQETALLVYENIGGLKIIDIIYGCLYILVAGFAIYTRFQLSGYKKKGPSIYLLFFAVNIIISVIYIGLVSLLSGLGFSSLLDTSSGTALITSIILLIINIFYFKKRAHLFVN